LIDQFVQIMNGHGCMPVALIRDDAWPCAMSLFFVTHRQEDRIE